MKILSIIFNVFPSPPPIFFLIVFMSIIINCVEAPQPRVADPNTKRTQAKKKDPEKQKKCSEIGSGTCDKDCKKICDDIFSGSAEKDCAKLSESLVSDFEEIIEDVEEGKINKVDNQALNCLLDLDDQEFVSAVKKMSSRQAKNFLETIANNEGLAKIFEEEDDEFNILKQVFKEASNSKALNSILKVSIDDSKPFFWLAGEEKNDPAFNWFNNFVDDSCSDSPSDCPGYDEIESLGAYCKVLLDFSDSKLKEFISDADLFEDEYSGTVEGADYEYTLSSGDKDFVDYTWHEKYKGDLKDFCRLETEITAGERKLKSREAQRDYFNSDVCKQNMKPAGGDADGSGGITSADETEIWRLKNCASNNPHNCVNRAHADYWEGFWDNEYVWEWGNVYGNTRGSFGSERLKGIGQSFWFLNEEKKIINPRINEYFGIYVRRGNIKAPNDPPRDPKTQKVRRASFMYYIMRSEDPNYPDCNQLAHRDTGNEDTCLYSYCLVDYELNNDNTVKTCDVLKCALGRPTTN